MSCCIFLSFLHNKKTFKLYFIFILSLFCAIFTYRFTHGIIFVLQNNEVYIYQSKFQIEINNENERRYKKINKRSTYKYVLKDGNKINYVGITDDHQRRESEHKRDKDFKKMEIIGRAFSLESAEKWETERINQYRRNHNGQVPPLNKTQNGK